MVDTKSKVKNKNFLTQLKKDKDLLPSVKSVTKEDIPKPIESIDVISKAESLAESRKEKDDLLSQYFS